MRKNSAMLVLLLLVATQSRADLVLSGQSVTGAFGMPMTSQERVWLSDLSIRRDFTDRGRAYTHLFDLGKKQAIIIDHFTRMAEVHDLAGLESSTEASAPSEGLKMKFEPTGNARPLQSWSCKEHDLVASIPTRLGNEEATFHLKGKIWVASGVPEQTAIKEMVGATKKKDFYLGIPALARISPAYSQVMNELMRKLAPKGLPCAGELEGSYEGNGPMVNLAKKLPTKLSFNFQQFSIDPIKPEMFVVPPGYRLMQRALPMMNLK